MSTELFISDIHGEYEAFSHIVRSASGVVGALVDETFADVLDSDARDMFKTLICYPEEKLAFELGRAKDDVQAETTLLRAEELLGKLPGGARVDTSATVHERVVAQCHAVQDAAYDRLHVVGDVYDRGPAAELAMDEIAANDKVDIQWGNHDIVWMGAALGQRGCIAHVVRNCARYGNLYMLERAYGIDVSELVDFALEVYADDPCAGFALKSAPELSADELEINVKVQKAMAILQFKVEAATIDEYPEFGLDDRKLLHMIDRENMLVHVDGVDYTLTDAVFPTVDFDDPYRLTEREEKVMAALVDAFLSCEKLQRHIAVFLEKGSLYKICGDKLLYHACVPLNADGSLKEVELFGETLKGRALFDAVDGYVRAAFTASDAAEQKRGRDLLWYLWLGEGSPLFAKSKMATFEIYLAAEKEARKEVKNPYYALLEDDAVVCGILEDFGMDPMNSRIVSGHVPVKVKDGEDPVKCEGKALIIDGGLSAAYQKTTGIAGFTLVQTDDELALMSHEPFSGRRAAIEDNAQLVSHKRVLS